MIAIFTVVTYIQQQQIAECHRQQEQQAANETRQKDLQIAFANLEIANQTRIQDQQIINKTRIHDRQIAEEQRLEDKQRQNDLHYQKLYAYYIEDISNVLYKQNQNQSFIDERKKLLYIRRKTIMTLRKINNERRTHLFIFLYENNLLPRFNDNSTLDLSGSDLNHIHIESSVTIRYTFRKLVLESVNLVSASFIDCRFSDSVDFTGSAMSNVNFTGSRFECTTADTLSIFDQTKLEHVDFNKTNISHIKFNDATLSYARFSHSTLSNFHIVSVNLVNTSFINCTFSDGSQFVGSLMTNVNFTGSSFQYGSTGCH
ncbi:unnamed protein product [Didymodactylos carnosus]|uniref:Pentapeptide repeat-containing protein n=1 Tax=Didymodactylos carnosus TaxID=1234261 RepID=A0A814P9U3_9BILA|nr:unnamed protein product [Didymodactylos carnosus]CAF1104727.1 unnamed protein product [Didymodactylos carnosus]CAF3707340.1 unnamed protein product [Didymodactylos carnosus]CAF3869359.1 unnamed protein product [Didymodactylos carnosus]